MDLLRLLAFSAFLLVVLGGLLFIADALHALTDNDSSVAEESADSEPEHCDRGSFHFDVATNLKDVIGTYSDIPIHRYAEIGGASYEFDYIYCPVGKMVVHADARCLAPGLVYSPLHRDAAPSR